MNFRGLALILGLCLLTSVAHGQTDRERSVARTTAKSGIQAFQEERYSDAVDLLEKAESIVHAPTHLLFIARSRVHLGRLVEAQEAYFKVINETLPANAPPAFFRAQDEARTEVKQLEGRIARLTLTVTGVSAEALSITVDGTPFPSIALGVPTSMNPGKHLLVVQAPGKKSQEISVALEEGQQKSLDVTLIDSQATPVAESASATVESGTEQPGVTRHRWGYGLAATGVVSLGVGTALGIIALGASDKALEDSSLCPNNACTPEGDKYISSAKTKAMIANISIGVGAALVGVGAYLAFTDPAKPQQEVARIEPMTGPGELSFAVKGCF